MTRLCKTLAMNALLAAATGGATLGLGSPAMANATPECNDGPASASSTRCRTNSAASGVSSTAVGYDAGAGGFESTAVGAASGADGNRAAYRAASYALAIVLVAYAHAAIAARAAQIFA